MAHEFKFNVKIFGSDKPSHRDSSGENRYTSRACASIPGRREICRLGEGGARRSARRDALKELCKALDRDFDFT